MTSNKINSALFITLVFIYGCSSDVQDVNTLADSSSFELTPVELVSSEVKSSDANWPDLKDHANASFRTCVTDTAYLERLVGERFQVETSQGVVSRVTNTQGCITWNEVIPFSYLEDEKFIEINGSIRASGNFRGSRPLKLALNPWRENLVDQSHGRVQTTSNSLRQNEESFGNRIATTNATLSVLKQNFHSDQTHLELEVTTQPQLIRRNLTGALVREAFNGGRFEVSYFLVSRNISTNRRRVINEVKLVEAINNDGRLKSRVRFVIQEGIKPKDVIELGIRIKAQNAPVELGSSEGLLPIKQLDGTVASELLELPENLETISFNTPMGLGADSSSDDFGFIIDSVSIRPGSEGGENSSGASDRRTVDAIFQVCMVDSLIKSSVVNYPFRINLKDSSNAQIFTGNVTTEARTGCANFRATIPYRRFDVQKWNDYRIEMISTREPFVDITKDRFVSINPWIRSGDFGIDKAVGTPPTITSAGATRPKIVIHNLNYNFIGHPQTGVKVNKSMDLQFSRTYMIEMQPMIQMDHRFEGELQGQERLTSGRYRQRVLILAPKANVNVDFTSEVNLRDFHTLSAHEQNVNIEGGFIRSRVEFPLLFTDLISFSHKNILLVELAPLDSGTSLQTGYFVGTFIGSRTQGSIGTNLESKRSLSTRDINISQTLLSRIRDLRNKLASDAVIPNNKQNFIAALQRDLKGSVTVIDHEKHKTAKKALSVVVFDGEQQFKNQAMISSLPVIGQFISNPNSLPASIINDVCHAFYPRTLVTKQMTYPPATGFSMSIPYDSSITGFEHKRCIQNFKGHFTITRAHHVANIVAQPRAIQTDAGYLLRMGQSVYTSGQQFTNATGTGKSDYFQYGWSASIGATLSKVAFLSGDFGISGGHRSDVFSTDTDNSVLSRLENTSVMTGQRFTYDRFNVDFQARVVKCLMINPKVVQSEIPQAALTPSIIDAFRRRGPELHAVSASKVVYLCKSAVEAESYTESYYFVKTGEPGTLNDADDVNGKLTSIIRGNKAFERFRTEMIESQRPLVFVKNQDPSLVQRFDHHMKNHGSAIDFDKRLDFTIPGLIEL